MLYNEASKEYFFIQERAKQEYKLGRFRLREGKEIDPEISNLEISDLEITVPDYITNMDYLVHY